MLFSCGDKSCEPVKRFAIPTLIALFIFLLSKAFYPFLCPWSVFLNLEGTLLLAFAISFPSGANKLKWWLYESVQYGQTPSFSYLNFYGGLICLVIGLVLGAAV